MKVMLGEWNKVSMEKENYNLLDESFEKSFFYEIYLSGVGLKYILLKFHKVFVYWWLQIKVSLGQFSCKFLDRWVEWFV